jgi:hypothetical protein
MHNCALQVLGFHNERVVLSTNERTEMRSRRDANRGRLRNGLKNAEKPTPIGLHTQGSYSMRTMVQDSELDYDIDDGAYFKKDDLTGPNGA